MGSRRKKSRRRKIRRKINRTKSRRSESRKTGTEVEEQEKWKRREGTRGNRGCKMDAVDLEILEKE